MNRALNWRKQQEDEGSFEGPFCYEYRKFLRISTSLQNPSLCKSTDTPWGFLFLALRLLAVAQCDINANSEFTTHHIIRFVELFSRN